MSEVQVSVLCKVYNHSKYLRKTLDGFVNQKTSFPFEVVVQDDASTDDSAEIIREYEKNYPDIIRPIYQTVNQYSQKLRNFFDVLFPALSGKYITVCEGDDFWSDMTKLQKQYDALEANPDCFISTHIVRNITEDGSPLPTAIPSILSFPEGVLNADELRQLMFNKEFYPFQTSSFFFRKELIPFLRNEAYEFCSIAPALDYVWVLCSLHLGNCYYFNSEMSCYRRNSVGSWSSNQKQKRTHDRFSQKVAASLAVYDRLTNQKFHDQLMANIADIEYNILSYRQQYRQRKNPKFVPIYQALTKRQRFLLGCCYYFPPFSPLYDRMKAARSAQLLGQ